MGENRDQFLLKWIDNKDFKEHYNHLETRNSVIQLCAQLFKEEPDCISKRLEELIKTCNRFVNEAALTSVLVAGEKKRENMCSAPKTPPGFDEEYLNAKINKKFAKQKMELNERELALKKQEMDLKEQESLLKKRELSLKERELILKNQELDLKEQELFSKKREMDIKEQQYIQKQRDPRLKIRNGQ